MERRLRFEIAGIDPADRSVEIRRRGVVSLVRKNPRERLERGHVLAIEGQRGLKLGARLPETSGREVAPSGDNVVPYARAGAPSAPFAEADCLLDPSLLPHPFCEREVKRRRRILRDDPLEQYR